MFEGGLSPPNNVFQRSGSAFRLVFGNVVAGGRPSIDNSTPRVGETLTADEGDVADPNGLPMNWPNGITWQWQQSDVGQNDGWSDVTGANASTFTVTDDQVGRRLRVRASFTDKAGNAEARDSAPTGRVLTLVSLDVDGNGTVGLLTDGLLLVRYLIDIRGPALTNLALAGNAHEHRDTHEEIAAYLQGLEDGNVLDVDGNGAVGLLTDGLLIVRYLIGTRGPALTNLALAADAREDRDTHEEIAAYLDSLVSPE